MDRRGVSVGPTVAWPVDRRGVSVDRRGVSLDRSDGRTRLPEGKAPLPSSSSPDADVGATLNVTLPASALTSSAL